MLPSTSSASESEAVKTPAAIPPEITIQDNTQGNNPKNIFNFVNKSSSLTDAEKYEILTNTWKPESTCSFPPENSSG
jgi:hypothetical protein